MKEPSIDDLILADGKQRDINDRERQIKEIEEWEKLLGTGDATPFGTTNKDEFLEMVETMQIFELQSIAHQVGVPPLDNEALLKKQLVNAFDDYIRRHRASIPTRPQESLPTDHPAYESIKHLIEEED